MVKFKPSQDIQPLSAFRANAASFLKRLRESRRPLVLTQNGRSAAVVLDVAAYDSLMDEVELIRDLKEARAQIDRGEGVPHDEAISQLRSRLKR